ncbi:PREDICTED: protein ALWAYS EARLY 3-like isoform X1 [Populus euphratica]|uniref:Protein ALWAYS EARLY 3-like isoform X1 n=2 Tax=Populus euphratica TaxID=75702 RepID=A0AAJ6V908_POPEU|nr:PREDICTED: protein ALWAYS EARLY 3-like isoform X1 [Populus euphratica]XP_011043236.1 PREDICTED: protein ALWAYS EARLY 3-like isoform X1 [Populus euphratica]
MAPSRKRSVNKRYSNVNEVTSTKNAAVITNKSKPRKRKLSEMLGPQWGKEELERFYKAYRKHGKDWEKVASAVRNRSVEMVEALYTMNKAYLSLPKGFASAAGLIAMMTDHYSNLGESESEIESNGGTGTSQKSQKHARVTKGSDAPPVPDLLQSQPASNYGCLSMLKKRRTGSKPWAVGKRTPRVPVTYSFDKYSEEKYFSPIQQGLKVKADAVDDDVAHEIALALTEASQRGGSPQVSQTPKRKTKMPSHAQHDEQMHAEAEMMSAKLRGSEMEEVGCELSLGSTEADVVDYVKDESFWKGKRYYGRRPPAEDLDDNLDDVREACSGTEEGQKLDAVKELFEMEVADTKLVRSSKGSRKRSKKVLFGEVEDADFDALEALADLSLRLPETPVDTGSSVYVEEEKTGIVAKSKLKGNPSSSGVKPISFKTTKQGKVFTDNASSIPEEKDAAHQFGPVMRKRRQKHLPSKISENEEHADSYLGESQKVEVTTDDNNFMSKGKRSQYAAHSKQGKLMKPAERTSSSNNHGRELNNSARTTIQVLSASQFNLPTKVRSSRKLNTPKMLVERDSKSSENIVNSQSNTLIPSFQDRVLGLKGKLSNCLSRYLVRRWCVFEWFYSAIDYPWFSKREFVEYLEHVRLGHIPRLTRVEWGVIRSSLGKPRRFSEQFLKEEKEKLNHYRESVREHYAELRTGTREGLPTDLARPLSVGQRIIALHPRTSEIQDGSILTVDHSRCHVQFDRPELGVEFVMDVDCMPSNPSENMPASMIGHNIVLNRYMKNLNELKISGQPAEKKMEGFQFSPCENLEDHSALPHASLSTYHCSVLLQQPMGGLGGSNTQVNNGGETVNTQQATNAQPLFCAQIQAKEADIHALSELTRALDKKEAVVSELKHMNDEVLESQKRGENSLKDSEAFKKHYAAVLLQLNEVNEQVSSALFFLRQRNTYQGNIPHVLSKSIPNIDEPACHGSSFDSSADDTQESGSHVVEIVESSRTKAQTMVDAAMQAMSSLKKEGSCIESIEDAIDFVNNKLLADDSSVPAIRSPVPEGSVQDTPASQDQLSSCVGNPGAINHAPDAKWNNLSNENEVQIPSELISHCVATLLMIQKCTERQFPPSHVAQVLDSAVTSLKPCCSVNLPVYAEIQKFMGIIKNQILALIPT